MADAIKFLESAKRGFIFSDSVYHPDKYPDKYPETTFLEFMKSLKNFQMIFPFLAEGKSLDDKITSEEFDPYINHLNSFKNGGLINEEDRTQLIKLFNYIRKENYTIACNLSLGCDDDSVGIPLDYQS